MRWALARAGAGRVVLRALRLAQAARSWKRIGSIHTQTHMHACMHAHTHTRRYVDVAASIHRNIQVSWYNHEGKARQVKVQVKVPHKGKSKGRAKARHLPLAS